MSVAVQALEEFTKDESIRQALIKLGWTPPEKLPENWWLRHHADCGVKYRGCHPIKCPKDQYEKTGVWIAEPNKNG